MAWYKCFSLHQLFLPAGYYICFNISLTPAGNQVQSCPDTSRAWWLSGISVFSSQGYITGLQSSETCWWISALTYEQTRCSRMRSWGNIDVLVHRRCNSSLLAMELHIFDIESSLCIITLWIKSLSSVSLIFWLLNFWSPLNLNMIYVTLSKNCGNKGEDLDPDDYNGTSKNQDDAKQPGLGITWT